MSEHERQQMIREALERAGVVHPEPAAWEEIAAWGRFLSLDSVELRGDETGTVLQMWQDGSPVAVFDLVRGEQA